MSADPQERFILPPDKSILHRLLIIGSLSAATIDIPLHSAELPADIEATIECLRALGVTIDRTPAKLSVHGVGIGGWKAPISPLNCYNSGTTARLLTGALCGQRLTATLTGDESLSQRPMKRLADLLGCFGADVETAIGDGLPLTINGTALRPAHVVTPVASAQLKSSLLLAALQTEGTSSVTEPTPSRDHTERMLQAFGVDIQIDGTTATIHSDRRIPLSRNVKYDVPSDISGAYYLIAAALLQQKTIKLGNVLLNPTRTKLLDLLCSAFTTIEITDRREQWNEMRGDISVYPAELRSLSLQITSSDIPFLIDDLPVLAVLAAFSDGMTVVEGADELRYKESDRIKLIVQNLLSFGISAQETSSGFVIHGKADFIPNRATVEHGGDHRIAMAFSLMAAKSAVTIPSPSVVTVSFPGYFTELEKIIGTGHIQFS